MCASIRYRAIEKAARQITSCRHLTELEKLLEVPKRKIALYSVSPDYYTFNLRKRDGSNRLIEAPSEDMKKLLKKLNFYLQSAYYFCKPLSSYGYILSVKREKEPRNILTHAQQHIGCNYLLNIDFEDFFHQFTLDRVFAIFNSYPFHFTPKTADILANLCTYIGRLPMGSPTSPVLSNLGSMELDLALEKWSKQQHLTYTRFVDDLSFSSEDIIGKDILDKLNVHFHKLSFIVNKEKVKWYGEVDTKIVTGLEVDSEIRVPGSFFYELSLDLKRLGKTIEASAIIEGNRPSAFVDKFKQQVQGKLNFLEMINGYDDKKYLEYLKDYERAISPKIEKLSLRWTDFPYDLD